MPFARSSRIRSPQRCISRTAFASQRPGTANTESSSACQRGGSSFAVTYDISIDARAEVGIYDGLIVHYVLEGGGLEHGSLRQMTHMRGGGTATGRLVTIERAGDGTT